MIIRMITQMVLAKTPTEMYRYFLISLWTSPPATVRNGHDMTSPQLYENDDRDPSLWD